MASKKPTLAKFYLAEKFDKNRNVSFNLKKEGLKKHTNFQTFSEALSNFIETAQLLPITAKVWFHRDGAFRGAATIEQAKIILNRVAEAKIQDQDVIEYINKENLVEKAPSKKMPLDKFLKLLEDAKIIAEINGKVKPQELQNEDIYTDVDADLVVESIVANTKGAFVKYHLTKDEHVSDTKVAYFDYTGVTPYTATLEALKLDAISEEKFNTLVKEAKVYAEVKRKSSATTVSSAKIKSDVELVVVVEEIIVLNKDKSYVKYHFTRQEFISESFIGELDYSSRDIEAEKLYVHKIGMGMSENFEEIVAKTKLYADVKENKSATLLSSSHLFTTEEVKLVVEQINIANTYVAQVVYHYEAGDIKSQSFASLFDFREANGTDILYAQDKLFTEDDFVKAVQVSSIYLDIEKNPLSIEISSSHVKTNSMLNVVIDQINVTSDKNVYVTYHFAKSGFISNSDVAMFDLSQPSDGNVLFPVVPVKVEEIQTQKHEEEFQSPMEAVEENVEQIQPMPQPEEVPMIMVESQEKPLPEQKVERLVKEYKETVSCGKKSTDVAFWAYSIVLIVIIILFVLIIAKYLLK
ncbi:hypothetical protein MCFN_01765 [Mycoplasmopsis californica]|uniref:Uncharacterized protein n=1 Tax=Mycoplasmopsis californica TaxID=2113 RepID=A0A059XLT2_9BACT|nr:hypothetical protein [Mycoplasmopsis californica]AIA29494.1 hypothetical protein MCFN_01765 [Mycoplasmopsis californica]